MSFPPGFNRSVYFTRETTQSRFPPLAGLLLTSDVFYLDGFPARGSDQESTIFRDTDLDDLGHVAAAFVVLV
jgi:hypothetical protein